MGRREEFLKRNVIALTLFSFFRGFSVSGYQALFSAYMKTLGYSMTSIGAALTVSSIIAALIAPGFGGIIEYYGARITTTATGIALVAALALLAHPSPPYIVFIVSYALFMLAFSLGQPARSTLLARSVPVQRYGYYVGITVTAFAAARIVGSIASGWIALKTSYTTLFAFLAVLAAIGVSLFHILSMEPKQDSTRLRFRDVVIGAYRRALKPNPRILKLYPLLVIDRSAWSLWFPLLSAHLKAVGYNEGEIGLLYTVQSVLFALSSVPWGRIADRIGPAETIALSEAIALSAIPLLASPTPWFIAAAGMAVVGFSIAAWIPAYNKLVAQLAGDRLGEAYANANAVRSLAGTPTPSIGGYLYQASGPIVVYSVSAVLMIASALYAYKVLRCPKNRKRRKAEPNISP